MNVELIKERMSQERLLVTIIADLSGSMNFGGKWTNLVKSLRFFIERTLQDDTAKAKVDLQIIGFNDEPIMIQDFMPIDMIDLDNTEIDSLKPSGCTAMNKAVNFALDRILEQRDEYESFGIRRHHRKLTILLSDGGATEDMTTASERVRKLKDEEGLAFWAVGIGDESCASLKRYFDVTLLCKDYDTHNFFNWASEGLIKFSESKPGDRITLPDLPRGEDGVVYVDRIPDELV